VAELESVRPAAIIARKLWIHPRPLVGEMNWQKIQERSVQVQWQLMQGLGRIAERGWGFSVRERAFYNLGLFAVLLWLIGDGLQRLGKRLGL
jgi:hypothetical protein